MRLRFIDSPFHSSPLSPAALLGAQLTRAVICWPEISVAPGDIEVDHPLKILEGDVLSPHGLSLLGKG